MIIPYMYPTYDALRAGAGSYKLPDAIEMEVTEERNGAFDLQMQYLYAGENAGEITCERFVMAVPQRAQAEEPFRVYEIDKPISGVITVKAHHISYDLDGYTLEPFTATGIANIVSAINTQLSALGAGFLLVNDGLMYAGDFEIKVPTSAAKAIGGENGLLALTGAEISYTWDAVNQRETVTLHAARGTVSTATVAYGFNLLSADASVNSDAVYSSIFPYYAKEENGVLTLVTLPEKTLSTGATTSRTRALPVDLTSRFDQTPTQADLRTAAQDYIAEVSWNAVTSCAVDFVPLQNTTEYKDNIDEQALSLCDTVTVSADVIGISMTSKVVKTVYNQLSEKYTEMTVGTIEQNIADTIAGMLPQSTGNVRGSASSYGGIAELWTGSLSNGNSVTIDGISDYTLFIFRVTENALPIFCAKLTTSGGSTYIRGIGGYASGASSELAIYVNASLSGNTMTLTNCHGLSGTTRTAKTVYKIYGIV